MKNLAIALFSTLVAFSGASFWEAGPCPPKPEVVTPFEAEGVRYYLVLMFLHQFKMKILFFF